jgi:hypothetical protein
VRACLRLEEVLASPTVAPPRGLVEHGVLLRVDGRQHVADRLVAAVDAVVGDRPLDVRTASSTSAISPARASGRASQVGRSLPITGVRWPRSGRSRRSPRATARDDDRVPRGGRRSRPTAREARADDRDVRVDVARSGAVVGTTPSIHRLPPAARSCARTAAIRWTTRSASVTSSNATTRSVRRRREELARLEQERRIRRLAEALVPARERLVTSTPPGSSRSIRSGSSGGGGSS